MANGPLKMCARGAIPLIYSLVRNSSSKAQCFYDCLGPTRLSAEQAVAKFVQSGSSVWLASGASTPQALLNAMVDRSRGPGGPGGPGAEPGALLKDVHVHQLVPFGPMPHIAPESKGAFRTSVFFAGANMREAVNSGRADYVPVFISDIPLMFSRGLIRPDVVLIQVSAPDQHGNCSINCVDATVAAMESAKYIIAEVNPQAPRTFGDSVIHWSRLAAAVEADHPLPEVAESLPSAAEKKVAEIIAENLIQDGCTIQLGIGGIPDATYAALAGHRRLRIHSELLTTGVMRLVAAGAVDPATRMVASLAWGTSAFFEFLNNNSSIELQCIRRTNKHSTISQQRCMTAINSCIELDTTGQIASDSIGYYIYSGFGGQVDFLRGAACSEDGKGRSIIAITSTTKNGSSRIVPQLREGAGVVSTRAHVHYVATEYGIADLFAQPLRTRAHRLINIAAPQHREQLERAAFKRLGVMPGE